ncbi:hypothetical protein CPC08DRAFT_738261 [Agrocybe pediades]|nr:hypothetical protein CPC08DRAFT_738261 [Agrocybe pediades]
MESLNLNTLASSLPNSQQNAEAEKELLNDFKAAALSITTLYRSSRKNAKRAYNAGYAAACQDQLNFIQQGVSTSHIGQSSAMEGSGMSIGRIMDWTEARLEAVRSREEEEDEDEEREKDRDSRDRPTPRSSRGPNVVVVKPSDPNKKPAESIPPKDVSTSTPSLPTPSSPTSHTSNQGPSEPSSPSPPPSTVSSRPNTIRPTKSRPTPTRDSFRLTGMPPYPPPTGSPAYFTGTFDSTVPFPETPVVVGSKRRHAVMRMLDSVSPATAISIGGGASSTVSSPGGVGGSNNCNSGSSLSRRRTRSSRNLNQLQAHNQSISVIQMDLDNMDTEEDEGRDRKRVARR